MGWMQAGRRFASGLALFALALQLVLAFGHIHPEDFAGIKPGVVIAAQGGGEPTGDHHGLGLDACAICATVHLAGTLLTPAAPSIVLPASAVVVRLDSPQSRAVPPAPALSFQARGPPQA